MNGGVVLSMKRCIKNILGNRKGYISIETVIGSLIFLAVICCIVDLAIISWKFNFISQTNTYIARTIESQSGIKTKAPNGFPGKDKAYVTSTELYNNLIKDFGAAGFDNKNWEVLIDGKKLTANSNFEFKDPNKIINVEIRAKYKWTLISNFIPGNLEKKIASKRSVYGDFRYRQGDVSIIKNDIEE